MKANRGFSILEVLLALSITLVVMAMVAQTLSHVAAIYHAQTEVATSGSSVALALDDIAFEISLSGQGLGKGVPAVLPTRPGTRVSASTLTLRSNPDVAASYLLEAPGENGEPTPVDAASYFEQGDLVVVTDARGRVERARVVGTNDAAIGLRSIDSADGEFRGAFTPESAARVLALREVHYFLDDMRGELVKNVEGVSRRVLAQGVTGLSFEYLDREGESIALAKVATSGELATVRIRIAYDAGEEAHSTRSLVTAVTLAPRSGTVDFEQRNPRFRLSRTFYPLDRPAGVASRVGADWAVVLSSGVNPTSDPAYLYSFQLETQFLGAGVENVTHLDNVRAPVTLAFAPETGLLSGSLFIAAWGLRVGHLSRIAPDGYGRLSAESEMTTFEGTEAIAQSGGMAFGVDEALYVTSREKGAIYRFRFEAGGKPSQPERMFPVTGTPGAMSEGADGHLYFLMNHGLTGSIWKMAFDETLSPMEPVRIGTLPGTGVALARDPVEGTLFALVMEPTGDSAVAELTRGWIESGSGSPDAPPERPTIRFSLREWLTRLEEGDVDPLEIPFSQAELPEHLAYLRISELDFLSFDALGSLYLGSKEGNLVLKFELARPSGRYAVGVAAGVVDQGVDLTPTVRMHAWKKTVLGL